MLQTIKITILAVALIIGIAAAIFWFVEFKKYREPMLIIMCIVDIALTIVMFLPIIGGIIQ